MIRRGAVAAMAWGLLTASPAASADPLGVQDLILLVQGGVADGVIVQHLQRWGLGAELSAGDLVALRAAGATQDLLARLAGTIAQGSGESRALPLPGGGGVLLTNLDADGRRIGGEAPESAATNQIQPAALGAARCPDDVGRGREAEPAHAHRSHAPPAEEWGRREPAAEALAEEPWGERAGRRGQRLGTPGGYTRYKLHYSREPESGFRTWVLPVSVLVHTPAPWGGVWAATFTPPVIIY